MCRMKYAEFFDELWENMGLTIPQVAARVNEKFGEAHTTTADQIYEFLKGKHCPNAAFAKAIEFSFQVNLPPQKYGFGEVKKP